MASMYDAHSAKRVKVKSTVERNRASGTSKPVQDESAGCKFKQVERPGLGRGEIDVEALLRSLETRNASRRAPQAAETREETKSPEPVAAQAAAAAGDGPPAARMSEEDLQEIARVLKMSRSVASAKEWGLRLLAETRRAREAEKQLSGEA